jgi:Mrp family chromosome partitioning ATPase/capsular polysaccharide biosynthesis protein
MLCRSRCRHSRFEACFAAGSITHGRYSMNDTTDIATSFAPIWKRKWLILLIAILVGGLTYAYYHGKPNVYSASTQLDLGSGSEAQQLVGGSQNRTSLNSRAIADAATLMTSSSVSEAVRARLRSEHVPSNGLGKVRAKAAAESYLVTITAEAHGAKAAARLANAYALAYIEDQHSRYRRQVEATIANTRRQLHRIEAAQVAAASAARRASSGKGSGSSRPSGTVSSTAVIQAASLASKVNQLESELSISTVQQVNPAKAHTAQLVSPTPRKNAIFGFVLGLLLASAAVFALSRFERRLGSLARIEAILKAHILTVLPRVKTPIEMSEGESRVAEPLLEPLRRLHTALQMGDMLEPARRTSARVILFLSADKGDGKSTLVATLALAQREAGMKVAVIEADLRRPVQAGLLSVNAPFGLTEVLAGVAPLEQAMQSVGAVSMPTEGDLARAGGGLSTVIQSSATGSLSVLRSGDAVANPLALLGSPAMQELLRSAAADHDYVLIDAPPPLQVSDVMPMMHWVDGIVLVARLEHTHEASAEQLTRLLADSSTAPVLGVVANAVSGTDIRRSGYSSTYGERRWPRLR